MNFNRLEKEIQKEEGFSATPYQDVLGVWTIGYGFTSIGDEKVTSTTRTIDKSFANFVLYNKLYIALKDAQVFFPPLFTLTEDRQIVVVQMAYQLGLNKLLKFNNMKHALQRGDYIAAAKEIRNSLLYKQTKNRAERYAQAMEYSR